MEDMADIVLKKVIKDYRSSEAYKTLRTNIEFSGADKKVIVFTSCIPNEGKSTVTMGLAEALAEGVLYLIEHPQEADRMGRKARKIAEVANAQAVFEQWRDYLNEVMKNGKRC